MTDRVSQQNKWNLLLDLTDKQLEIHAEQIWKGCNHETPNTGISYESFCRCLNNNELSIAD